MVAPNNKNNNSSNYDDGGDDYGSEKSEEKVAVVVDDALFKRSIELKEQGNLFVSNREYQRATIAYRAGIQLLEKEQEQSGHDRQHRHRQERLVGLYVKLLNNCALTLMKLGKYEDAEQCCNKAVDAATTTSTKSSSSTPVPAAVSSDLGKALYRRAQARHSMYLEVVKNESDESDTDSRSANNNNNGRSRGGNSKKKNNKKKVKNRSNENANETSTATTRNVEKVLIAGIDDIQRAIEVYDTNSETKSRKECQQILDLMETEFNKIQERKLQSVVLKKTVGRGDRDVGGDDDDNNNYNTKNTSGGRPSSNKNDKKKQTIPTGAGRAKATHFHGVDDPPSVEQQKQDIIRLLESNQKSVSSSSSLLLKQQRSGRSISGSSNSNLSSTTSNGDDGGLEELYCIIEWTWWLRWCHRVNLFDNNDSSSINNLPNTTTAITTTTQKILKILPPGAHVPQRKKRKTNTKSISSSSASDDDTDDDSSTSSDDFPDELGPIDNTCLLVGSDRFSRQWYHRQILTTDEGGMKPEQDSILLRPNLVRGYHYEILPREVYNALRVWYGEVIPAICRRRTRQRTVVLYPQQIESGRSRGALLLPSMAPSSGRNGIARCSACFAPDVPNNKCRNCKVVSYCNKTCQTSHWPYHKPFCNRYQQQRAEERSETDGDGRIIGQYPSSMAMSLPQQSYGRVGLSNLGNTCFMNSAIQALSHATPLTRFFLSGNYEDDINTDNPLGSNGKLARAYGNVMKELWMNPDISSFSPSALKRAVAAFAPRFAGYQQHDAQEFLAYLLDGLHEDLNRIRRAPYVEMPDVTDGHDLAIAGAEAWDAHMKRNDSLVLDSFYGQFQSTCVCPRCNRVSVSFDAFNHISLEIPQGKVTVNVLLHRYEGGLTAYAVKATSRSTLNDVKHIFADMVGIPVSELFMFDAADNEVELNSFIDAKRPVASLKGVSEGRACLLAYQADDSDKNDVMHMIITNTYLPSASAVNDDAQKKKESDGDDTAEEDPSMNKKAFPAPIMTSMDAPNRTARDLWVHIWKLVRHAVIPAQNVAGNDNHEFLNFDDGPFSPTDFLAIHLLEYSGHGRRPHCIFPVNGSEGEMTSMIPPDGNLLLTEVLGGDFAERYLFLELEWKDLPPQNGDPVPLRVDTNQLFNYVEDESFLEAQKENKMMNGSRSVSLDECLRSFSTPERLDNQNTWYCSNCKDHVRALKTMRVWRLPNILIIHLKRFEFRNVFRRDKLDTLVDFPLEGLNMDPYSNHRGKADDSGFMDDRVPSDYDLFAVVNHFGRMGFGHYTAFARSWDETGPSRDWSLFDDSRVLPVNDPREIVGSAAYILFYRRRQFH